MATNRSQIYIDTIDNTSSVLQGISRQVQLLQTQMAGVNSSGFARVNSHLSTQTGLLQGISNSIADIPNMITGVATKWLSVVGVILTVKKASEELFNFYKSGVEINVETEKSQIGIAGLIASAYKLKENGIEVKDSDKLSKSLLIAEDAMKRLRISAITTGASVSEIFDAYQQAISPGASLGLDYKQVEKVSTLIANTVKSMNLPKGQAGQEMRALLSGKIDRTATIGTNLGFGAGGSNEKEYKAALKKGGDDFTNFIDKQMQYFNKAGEFYVQSLGGIFDNLGEGFSLFKAESTKTLAESLKGIKPIIDDLFIIDKDKGIADFTEKLDGVKALLLTIGSLVGDNIVGAFKIVVGWVLDFSEYILNDQTLLNGIITIIDNIGTVFGAIIDIGSTIFSLIVDIGKSFLGVLGFTTDTNESIDGMHVVIKTVTTATMMLSLVFQEMKVFVVILADAIRSILGGAIDFVTSTFRGFIISVANVAGKIGSTGDGSMNKSLLEFADKLGNKQEKMINAIGGGENNTFTNAEAQQKLLNEFADKKNEIINNYIAGNNKENSKYQEQLKKIEEARKNMANQSSKVITTTSMYSRNNKGDKGGSNPDTMNSILKSYEDELKAFKEKNDFERKNNDLLYSNFKMNVQDYYDFKTKIDKSDFDKQQETYKKELEFLETQKGSKKNAKANIEVENKILEITTKKENSEREYNLRKKETLFNLDKELSKQENLLFSFKSGIDEILGNSGRAQKIKLQIEVENLNKENQQNPEMLGLIKIYDRVKQFKIDQEQQNQLLSLSEEKLNILRENGSLVTIDYYKEMGKLNSERLKQYEDELKLIKELAPDEQDNVRIKELENLILKTRANLDPLAKDIKKTFQDSFGTFFSDVISGTKSIKDAFKDLVSSISNYLSKLVSEKLAQQIFGGGDSGGLLGSLFGGSSSSSGGGGFADLLSTGLSSLFGGGRATGGFVDPGKFYKWNEHGDEMFFSNSGGYVMNASRTNDLLKGGGSNGGVNNINVTLATPNYSSFNNSEGQVGAMISNALRKAQRNL